MIEVAPLDITRMLAVNEQGIPFAPNIRQIQDKDVRELYVRDKTPTKIDTFKKLELSIM